MLIGALGFGAYRLYVVPRYIEPLLETAASILNDETMQKEIVQLVRELSDKGMINSSLAEGYIKDVEKQINAQNDTSGDTNKEKTEKDNTVSALNPASENSVGAKSVKVQEEESKKYGYGTKSSKTDRTPSNSSSGEDVSKYLNDSEKSLYERVKSQVDQKDITRACEIIAKLDMATVRSLLSNRAELKKYLMSALTESEYSEALEMYLKYAHLIR